MIEDRFTNTEADAGRFELWASTGGDVDPDRPTRADAEVDAEWDEYMHRRRRLHDNEEEDTWTA